MNKQTQKDDSVSSVIDVVDYFKPEIFNSVEYLKGYAREFSGFKGHSSGKLFEKTKKDAIEKGDWRAISESFVFAEAFALLHLKALIRRIKEIDPSYESDW